MLARTIRRATVLFAASALALAAAAAASAASADNNNPATFTGSPGDGNGAPDIGQVTISSDANGQIVFQIATDEQTLPASAALVVFVDSDQNASTGTGNDGIEYILSLDNSGVGLVHWTGALTAVAAPTLSGSFANSVGKISINRSDLGGTSGLNFFVASLADESLGMGAQHDAAPDIGVWNYQLQAGAVGTAPATPVAVVKLNALSFQVDTAKPGRPFGVSMIVAREDTGMPIEQGVLSCSARLGGRPLRVSSTFGPLLGVARCQWQLPRNARGKRIFGTIRVTLHGSQLTRSFATTVK